MKEEVRNGIIAGIAFGVLITPVLFFIYGFLAFIAGPLAGIGFGIGIYSFLTSSGFKEETAIGASLEKDVIHSGGANYYGKLGASGGKLYLLKNHLHFKSHDFNFERCELVIETSNIKTVETYNILGLISKGIMVETKDGKKVKFLVENRNKWKTEFKKVIPWLVF